MNFLRPYFILLVLLLGGAIPLVAASLVMPVLFTIENGTYENTFVNVKKNGESIYSVPGEKNLRLKLELNADYVLSFSKNGYITKQIHVSTDIPDERVRGGLDPYKIGVRLFKQYEGVNIVVYNQPVAFIRYLIDTDDMGYDVDYTKSIMSELQQAESTLEKKAMEEREQLAIAEKEKAKFSIPVTNPNNSIPSPASLAVKFEIENNTTTSSDVVSQGVDHSKNSVLLKVQTGQDEHSSKLSPEAGEDVGHALNMEWGADINKPIIVIEGGEDKEALENNVLNEITKSVTVTDEPNRKITFVYISNGEHHSSYKKIEYNWGGKFYFKDDKISISYQLFSLFTGMN